MPVLAARPPTTTPTPTTDRPTPSRAAWAGVVYVTAWVIGLAVQPSGPALDASDGALALHYADHTLTAAIQSLLVHGVAAVALLVVALGVAGRARSAAPRAARVLHAAGITAALLSAVQMIAGVLAATTVGAGDTGRAGVLFDVVGRVDGVKMVALGVMVAAGVAVVRRTALPGWLRHVGVVLVGALAVAAAGYLLMSAALAPAAAPALLLLLVWVCGAGIAASRS